MNILALDTCTESVSVALLYQGERYEHSEVQRGQADSVLIMIDNLLAQAGAKKSDIEYLAYGRGPGSFTGVRVGVGVAQGIAYARDIPVIPVSSLAAVAQYAADSFGAEHIAVAMDARMSEIYCASYQNCDGLVVLQDEERVCPASLFMPAYKANWLAAGTGWQQYESDLKNSFIGQVGEIHPLCYPQASAIIKLAQQQIYAGKLQVAEQARPVYLRNKVAKKKGEK